MKPESFKNQNVIFAKDQPEYIALPAHRDKDGLVTTMWSFSAWERIKILFGGRLVLQFLTFNNPLQPVKIEILS